MKKNVVIRKQKIRISTSDEQLALKLRSEVSDSLQYDLLDVYDNIFNAKEFDGLNTAYINKISIDIGRCTETDFHQKFAQLVWQALIEHLHYPVSPEESLRVISAEQPETESAEAGNAFTALLYYLQYSILPWWFTGELYQSPAQIFNSLTDAEVEKIVRKIIEWNKEKHAARSMVKRLLNLLDAESIKKILDISTTVILNSSGESESQLLQFRVFFKLFNSQNFTGTSPLNIELAEWLLLKGDESKQDLTSAFAAYIFRKYNQDFNAGKWDTENIVPDNVKQFIRELVAKQKLDSGPDDVSGEFLKHNKENKYDVFEDGIYITNAGLIILHPFLPALFDECMLTNADGLFVDQMAAYKAVALLHYLQTGREAYEEQWMAFNKILCGLHIVDALPPAVTLQVKEKRECDILLKTVVHYWEALKGASVDTVRESFLSRNGKLSMKEGNWLLQVERQTVDVLIDRLPWGISTVKLPWVDHLIYTEW